VGFRLMRPVRAYSSRRLPIRLSVHGQHPLDLTPIDRVDNSKLRKSDMPNHGNRQSYLIPGR
jgi:hypothetical protein